MLGKSLNISKVMVKRDFLKPPYKEYHVTQGIVACKEQNFWHCGQATFSSYNEEIS